MILQLRLVAGPCCGPTLPADSPHSGRNFALRPWPGLTVEIGSQRQRSKTVPCETGPIASISPALRWVAAFRWCRTALPVSRPTKGLRSRLERQVSSSASGGAQARGDGVDDLRFTGMAHQARVVFGQPMGVRNVVTSLARYRSIRFVRTRGKPAAGLRNDIPTHDVQRVGVQAAAGRYRSAGANLLNAVLTVDRLDTVGLTAGYVQRSKAQPRPEPRRRPGAPRDVRAGGPRPPPTQAPRPNNGIRRTSGAQDRRPAIRASKTRHRDASDGCVTVCRLAGAQVGIERAQQGADAKRFGNLLDKDRWRRQVGQRRVLLAAPGNRPLMAAACKRRIFLVFLKARKQIGDQ